MARVTIKSVADSNPLFAGQDEDTIVRQIKLINNSYAGKKGSIKRIPLMKTTKDKDGKYIAYTDDAILDEQFNNYLDYKMRSQASRRGKSVGKKKK
mgnify:CR=1 FL=1